MGYPAPAMSLERFDTPLLRRALLVAFVAIHILSILAPADVLAPVDPWQLGRKVWEGQIPYRDFPLEYPPGSILAFLLPGAAPHALAPTVLALQAVAAEAAVIWFVLRRVDGAMWRWVPLSMLLFPLLAGGFDALPMAAIAASTALLAAGTASGWWVAALGAIVKLSPATAWVWGRTAWPTAVFTAFVTGAVLLAPSLLARHPDDGYLGYSLHRGVQVESVAATTTWVRHRLTGEESQFAYRFKAHEIDGADVSAAVWALLGLAGLGIVALKVVRDAPVDPWLAAFATLTIVLTANKVLSPQFIAWPAPVAAVLGGVWFRAWLVITGLTMAAYLGDGPTWILTCAAVRNAALVVVAVAAVRRL